MNPQLWSQAAFVQTPSFYIHLATNQNVHFTTFLCKCSILFLHSFSFWDTISLLSRKSHEWIWIKAALVIMGETKTQTKSKHMVLTPFFHYRKIFITLLQIRFLQISTVFLLLYFVASAVFPSILLVSFTIL